MAETWRNHANAVIADALTSLPASATAKEIRAHLQPYYPFGERKMYPYKVWLSAVSYAIRRRGAVIDRKEPKEPCLIIHKSIFVVLLTCDWCGYGLGRRKQPRTFGCIKCAELFSQMKTINASPDFQGLAAAAKAGDRLAVNVLSDWLRERGYEDLANVLLLPAEGT